MQRKTRIFILAVLLFIVAGYAGYLYTDGGRRIDIEKLQQQVGLAPRFIYDQADLLPDEDEKYLVEYHDMLLRKFDIDYRVYTVNGLADIEEYAYTTFNKQKVGSRSSSGRGLLLVIDPASNALRIEVSANLESVYPDAFIAYLETRQMVPFFNLGRVLEGIFATSELIRVRAIQAKQGMEFDPIPLQSSLGGGASADAGIDGGRDDTFSKDKPDVLAADTVEETHRRFLQSFVERNGRWDLDIYTEESKKYMSGRVISAAQMDNAAKVYHRCVIEHIVYNQEKTLAVLTYALSNRGCDPFMYEKGTDGKWRIDLKTVGTSLGHTFGNIWYVDFRRFEQSGFAKYDFGFKHFNFRRHGEDRFDHQGIPYYWKYGMQFNYVLEGCVIEEINGEDSFMGQQGFQVGDVILQWETARFPHQNFLTRRMLGVKPGLDIYIRARRGDIYFEKTFKAPPYPAKGELRFGVTFHSRPWSDLLIVHYVEPGAMADRLGLKEGDRIASWQGVENADGEFVYDLAEKLQPGDNLTAKVYRDGDLISLATTVGEKRTMGKVE